MRFNGAPIMLKILLIAALLLIVLSSGVMFTDAQSELTWTFETVGGGIKPAIALDGDGGLHVAFLTEAIPGALFFATRESHEWSVETVTAGYFYGPLDLAIGDENEPIIAVHDYQDADFRVEIGDAVIAQKNDGEWRVIPIASDGHDGWNTSLALDENGAWHLASIEPTQLELTVGLEYATNASGEIVVEAVGSGPLPYDFPPSIAIAPDGTVAISYFDLSQQTLFYAERGADGWTLENLGAEGWFSSLAFGPDGVPQIAYFVPISDPRGEVYYARRESSGWMTESIGELDNVSIGFGGASQLVSLVVDGDNQPHIMYGDKSHIFYAHRDASAWQTQIAVEQVSLGQHIDFALDAEGIPHLVFYVLEQSRPPNGEVFYARPAR
jgi:hypothetical protein